MDPNLPYVDIRACCALCQGGSSHADMVSEIINNQIVQAYNLLPDKLPDSENLIERKTIIISGDENTFRLAEIGAAVDNQNAPGAPGNTSVGFGGLQNLLTIFTTQHNDVQRTLNEL
jgi:hypothetical protein